VSRRRYVHSLSRAYSSSPSSSRLALLPRELLRFESETLRLRADRQSTLSSPYRPRSLQTRVQIRYPQFLAQQAYQQQNPGQPPRMAAQPRPRYASQLPTFFSFRELVLNFESSNLTCSLLSSSFCTVDPTRTRTLE